jgi:hypothetical protein
MRLGLAEGGGTFSYTSSLYETNHFLVIIPVFIPGKWKSSILIRSSTLSYLLGTNLFHFSLFPFYVWKKNGVLTLSVRASQFVLLDL